MTRRQIERSHHKAFVQFLNASMGQLPELRFIKHTKNESDGTGPKVTRRNRKTGKLIEIPLDVIRGAEMGVRSGVWDFEYLGPNRVALDNRPAGHWAGFALEFKAPGGTLEPEQKEWQKHYLRNMWYTAIFTSHVEAALFAVRWVGGDPTRFLFT